MDMSQYMGMFSDEASEHLQALNQSLLELENDPGNLEVLGEIFRSAHTLKGMSATMGFDKIANLTHEMESVLDKLRRGEMRATTETIDTLFKCLDTLESSIATVVSGGDEGTIDVEPLINRLRGILEGRGAIGGKPEAQGISETIAGEPKITYNEFEREILIEAGRKHYNGYEVRVFLDEGCLLKSARAYMVFRDMDEIGEIIKSVPDVPDIEDEKFGLDFTITLVTQESAERVKEVVENISEVDRVEINKIDLEAMLLKAEAPKLEEVPREGVAEEAPAVTVSDRRKPAISHTVRVDIQRLDSLMNLVGELVMNRAQLLQIGATYNLKDLNEILAQVGRTITELNELVMAVRMVPIETVFNRFPRMVRDMARDMGKKINLIIEGKETELDRTVVDEIGDPLMHLIRNSIDHGIEPPEERVRKGKPEEGTLKLSAHHEGNYVVIEVEDDGRGMDTNKIAAKALEKGLVTPERLADMSEEEKRMFIFIPGFSTSEEVTDVSGRGVGMDVVKNRVEALRGFLEIESEMGVGTKVSVKLPLTLAIIQALLVKLRDETYAIPLGSIEETVDISEEMINTVQGREVTLLRGEILPLLRLHKVYNVPQNGGGGGTSEVVSDLSVVVVRKGQKKVGFVVDSLVGQQEIVIKSLGKLLTGNVPGVAGATILGDGRVAMIVDVTDLI
ncbi:MAG: chemotaxis protein CheW [bacterium]